MGRPVDVQAYAEKIVIRQDGETVGEHPRCFARNRVIYDPWHYVPVLKRKPGALRNGAPFKDWQLPGAPGRLRARLGRHDDGDRQMVKILGAVLFNAWRELASWRITASRAFGRFMLLALLGPVCGVIGWFWLGGQAAILGSIMLFAAGGILYLTFQDIAPQARLEKHWGPPLGAVVGFALALVGEQLLTG